MTVLRLGLCGWLVASDCGFLVGSLAFEATRNEKPPGVQRHCEAIRVKSDCTSMFRRSNLLELEESFLEATW